MTNDKNIDAYLSGMSGGAGAGIALTTMAMAYVGDQLFIPLLILGVVLILISEGVDRSVDSTKHQR